MYFNRYYVKFYHAEAKIFIRKWQMRQKNYLVIAVHPEKYAMPIFTPVLNSFMHTDELQIYAELFDIKLLFSLTSTYFRTKFKIVC